MLHLNGLTIDPAFPLLQVVVFGVLAVGLALWLYSRGTGADTRGRWGLLLAGLRALVVAALALVLLNPVLTSAQKETSKPPLLVLLDTSHSMAVQDVDGQPRFEQAKRAVLEGDLLRGYAKQFTPVLFSLSEQATRQEADSFRKTARPDGGKTRIGEGLAGAAGAVAGARSGGILLVSDGRNNGEISPVEVARQARTRRLPVFTVCLGTTRQGRDVSVLNRRPQVYAAPGQQVSVGAEVRSVGYQDQTAQVQLMKDGRPVDSKPVRLDDRKPVPVSFDIQEPREGTYRYSVAVRPMPDEGSNGNNHSSVFLHVLDTKTRVLVLEGRPTWDAKFLIQALHTDPSIEVDAIFKLTGDKYFAVKGTAEPGSMPTRTVKVPTRPEELAKYDAVVIGKGYEEFFDEQSAASLKRYVAEHAGNLIFLRGRAEERATTLQALEPLQWSEEQVQDFRMQVTDEGRQNPAFSFRANPDPNTVIQHLPTMISATRVQAEKALTVVLARANGVSSGEQSREMAVLAYQNYGQGKVVSLVGQGLWRWSFLPPELKDYAGCYTDFWTQLVRWLVSQSDFLPGQSVSLKTDRTSYSPGDAVNLMAFVRGRNGGLPPLKVTAPDGHTTQLSLGKAGGSQADFVGTYKPRSPGEYLASLSMPGARSGPVMVPFSVYPSRDEDILTAADPELMRQIAQAGGGEALTLEQLSQLPEKLRDAQSDLITKTEARSAWDRWWILALILAVLGTEWLLRRRQGLA